MKRDFESGGVVPDDFSDRLRQARLAAGYPRPIDAITAFGWTRQYFQHERGERGPSKAALAKYARAFNVTIDWLQTGRGRGPNTSPRVNVMGRLGAGARVDPFPPGTRLETVERTPGDNEAVCAAIVHGSDLFPNLRDGDIVYWKEPEPPERLLGLECLVHMPDGDLLIRTLESGREPGLYTLVSYSAGSPPMRDVVISEASFVTPVKRNRPT